MALSEEAISRTVSLRLGRFLTASPETLDCLQGRTGVVLRDGSRTLGPSLTSSAGCSATRREANIPSRRRGSSLCGAMSVRRADFVPRPAARIRQAAKATGASRPKATTGGLRSARKAHLRGDRFDHLPVPKRRIELATNQRRASSPASRALAGTRADEGRGTARGDKLAQHAGCRSQIARL